MEEHIIIQQNHVLATIINLAGNLSLMDHIRLGVLNGITWMRGLAKDCRYPT